MSLRNFVSKWVPVITWMFLIFAGSSDALSAEHTSRFLVPFLHWLNPQISPATIAAIHLVMRKLGHLSEYAILAALLWRAFRSWNWSKPVVALCSLGIAAVYAVSDEFHQSFVPTRTPADSDVMIDICGAIVAVLLCWTLSRKAVRA